MRLKLDENLSRRLKAALGPYGHDVTTAADEGLLSRPDTEIAAASRREGRILLTLDLEFGNVRKYPPGTHPGIILFRPARFGPLGVNAFIETFIARHDLRAFEGCVAVVQTDRVRVRQPDSEDGSR